MDDRTITMPVAFAEELRDNTLGGAFLCQPVKVGWPELQLTEEQIMANAIALAWGRDAPFRDKSIFEVRVPRVAPRGN